MDPIEETKPVNPFLDSLIMQWVESHKPRPDGNPEKQFTSISELMMYLNATAGKTSPETYFDNQYVLEQITSLDYESISLGGVLHFVYY
jgi:hypothetical protein